MRTRDLEQFLIDTVVKGEAGAMYILREHLGSGGSGDVFRAEEVLKTNLFGKPSRIGREVAFKLIQPDLHEPDKFERELLLSTRLDHPNIVRGLDSGRTWIFKVEFIYLAMELAQQSLHKRLSPQPNIPSTPLPLAETLEVARAIASALVHTHSLEPRIVHFDVKPSNVLRVEGVWKLADFGLARVLEGRGALLTKTTSGTDDYKAPERFLPQEETPVDTAADLWALGTLLLACLGLLPIGAGMQRAMVSAVKQEDQPLPPGIPEMLVPILKGCLRANWRQRMPAREVLNLLNGYRLQPDPSAVVQDPLAQQASPAGTQLALAQDAEEWQVKAKEVELASLETVLTQSELDLTTLRVELRTFEGLYLRTVGVRYAELDAIKARIAALRAQQNPDDATAQNQAREAQARANESEREAAGSQTIPEKPAFTPSDALKKLYRSIAKRLHPDLANNDAERERRHHYMVEVNRAYEAGDENQLRELLREWESNPEATPDKGLGAALARLILKITQVKKRIDQTQRELSALRQSAIYKLRARADKAREDNRDLFSEMVAEAEREISEQSTILKQMEAQNAEP